MATITLHTRQVTERMIVFARPDDPELLALLEGPWILDWSIPIEDGIVKYVIQNDHERIILERNDPE